MNMKIPPSTAPNKPAGKIKVASSKAAESSEPLASDGILPAQTQQVLLSFQSQMAQQAPPAYEDIFGTGQQSLTKDTPQGTPQETPQGTPQTPQEVAVLPSYEEATATRIANQPALSTRGATNSPISQPTAKPTGTQSIPTSHSTNASPPTEMPQASANTHTPQSSPSAEEPPQLPSYEEAVGEVGGKMGGEVGGEMGGGTVSEAGNKTQSETSGEAKSKAANKTSNQDFLNSLQTRYDKEAIGYVMERFYYHFQKPPEPVFSPIEQKALVAALENYATTAKAVETVAQKFGRDNAWQGLFKINQDSENGFDGIFAPEPLDRQKLERQITATATELKQEGINAPPSSRQDWIPLFFHSFSLRDSNPQITAPSLVASHQVTQVKMANLPKRMEQIYLSHSRTLRLMDASRRANKIARDAVKVRRLVVGQT